MTQTTVDLEFLARQMQKVLDEMRSLRKEVSDMRSLTLQSIDYSRRIERRMAETRDDLELMIKAELSGALGHMQTTLEHSLSSLAERIEELEKRPE